MNAKKLVLLVLVLGMLSACRQGPASPGTPAAATATPKPTAAQAAPTITPTAAPLARALDLRYAQTKGMDPNLQSLDVYYPNGLSNRPVLVMIHGGGWYEGDKTNPGVALTKAKYFTGQGWVLVSINYRLTPAVQHPAHVQDVAAALAWVSNNISNYGGDPGQISIMGHSAGAHLAALVATDERYLKQAGQDLSLIKHVVLLDGAGYDLPEAVAANDSLKSMYLAAFGSDPAVLKDASPVTHIAKGKGIPPFFILYAGKTPSGFEYSEEMFTLLNAAGVPAAKAGIPDKSHTTINSDVGTPGDWMTQQIINFLTR